ncbi:hypothetical protein [Streptomyces sp. NPDC051776]|uniref:hypothetical protein n=1 Tax=Streptomyces sp. NPDC051776 TaxID=3155414 RepID=UPI00344AC11B
MAHRRRMTVIAALAAVAVVVPVTTACSAVEKALDCAQTADAILTSVEDLQQAASSAADNPAEAERALDRIDKNLDDISDKTDNADVSKAVDELNASVKDVRKSIEQGKTPDVTPVTNAANELTKVCSS